MDPLADIKAALQAKRKRLMDEIAQTPEGQALVKIDAALDLLGEGPVQLHTVSAPMGTPSGDGDTPAAKRNGRGRSVKAMAQALLDEAPRAWSYDEIISEYASRGEPIEAADPRSALRTAMWTLTTKENFAVKLDDGRFKSAKFATAAQLGFRHEEDGP